MADNLRIRVVLDMVDRVLAPLRRVSQGGSEAARTLKAARDRLKELNAQQRSVSDFREVRAGLKDTAAKLDTAQQKVRELAQRMGQAGPPTKAMAREFNAVKAAAAALTGQHDRQSQKVQQLRDRLTTAGISVSSLSAHERRLRGDIAATTAAIAGQTQQLQQQAAEQRRLASLRQAHAKAMMHTGMAAGAGIAMQAAGSRAVRTAMQPVGTFAAHEDAMLGVARQVPGARDELGTLTPVYRAIEQQVRELSEQIPLPTTQIAEMVTAAARMEVPTDQLKDFTRVASQMATAFDAVPDHITEAMGKVAKNFKIPLTAIESLADSINYLDDNAISKGSDIIDFLNRTSGVVSTVAMSARDAAALGSTLLTLGERTETAGTATNAIVQKFAAATKGTKKFRAAVAEIGLTTKQVQKGMSTDAMGMLDKVVGAIRKLPQDQRIGVMVELVGLEHSDTLAKLVDKPEELARQRKLANGDEAQGSMGREAAARNATLSAQWRLAQNRSFNLAATIGETLKPALIDLMNAINPLLSRAGAWVRENQGLVSGLLKVVLVIGGLIAATGAVLLPLALIAGKVMLVRFLFLRLFGTTVLGMAGRFVGALMAVARGIGMAFLWLGRALLANPIVLAIGLLIAAGYLLWRNWEGIKGGVLAIWQELGGGIGAVLQTVGAAIVNWSPLGLFYRAFAAVLGWFGVELPAKFSTFGQMLMSGLVAGITNKLGTVREAIGGVADSVVGWFKDKLGIRSPSRVFIAAGAEVGNGAAVGIESRKAGVRRAALGLAAATAVALPLPSTALPPTATAWPLAATPPPLRQAPAITNGLRMDRVRIDRRPPLMAAPAAQRAPAAAAAPATYNITIHAAPGMDAQALARTVSAELDRRERVHRNAVRSSLSDID